MSELAQNLTELSMDENERIAIAVLENTSKNTVANLGRVESKVDAGFLRLETRIDGLDKKVDQKFDALDKKIDEVDKKFDGKFDAVVARIDRLKDWSIGIAVSLLGAIATSHFYLSNRMDKMAERLSARQDGMRHDLSARLDTLSAKQDVFLGKLNDIAVAVATLQSVKPSPPAHRMPPGAAPHPP